MTVERTPGNVADVLREWSAEMAGRRVGWVAVWKPDKAVRVRFASALIGGRGARHAATSSDGANSTCYDWDGFTDSAAYTTAWQPGEAFEIFTPQYYVTTRPRGESIRYFADTPDEEIAWVDSPGRLLAVLREKLAALGAEELYNHIYYTYNAAILHEKLIELRWLNSGIDSVEHAKKFTLIDPAQHGATRRQVELVSSVLSWATDTVSLTKQVARAERLGWFEDGAWERRRNQRILKELYRQAKTTQIALLVVFDNFDHYRDTFPASIAENARWALSALWALHDLEQDAAA